MLLTKVSELMLCSTIVCLIFFCITCTALSKAVESDVYRGKHQEDFSSTKLPRLPDRQVLNQDKFKELTAKKPAVKQSNEKMNKYSIRQSTLSKDDTEQTQPKSEATTSMNYQEMTQGDHSVTAGDINASKRNSNDPTVDDSIFSGISTNRQVNVPVSDMLTFTEKQESTGDGMTLPIHLLPTVSPTKVSSRTREYHKHKDSSVSVTLDNAIGDDSTSKRHSTGKIPLENQSRFSSNDTLVDGKLKLEEAFDVDVQDKVKLLAEPNRKLLRHDTSSDLHVNNRARDTKEKRNVTNVEYSNRTNKLSTVKNLLRKLSLLAGGPGVDEKEAAISEVLTTALPLITVPQDNNAANQMVVSKGKVVRETPNNNGEPVSGDRISEQYSVLGSSAMKSTTEKQEKEDRAILFHRNKLSTRSSLDDRQYSNAYRKVSAMKKLKDLVKKSGSGQSKIDDEHSEQMNGVHTVRSDTLGVTRSLQDDRGESDKPFQSVKNTMMPLNSEKGVLKETDQRISNKTSVNLDHKNTSKTGKNTGKKGHNGMTLSNYRRSNTGHDEAKKGNPEVMPTTSQKAHSSEATQRVSGKNGNKVEQKNILQKTKLGGKANQEDHVVSENGRIEKHYDKTNHKGNVQVIGTDDVNSIQSKATAVYDVKIGGSIDQQNASENDLLLGLDNESLERFSEEQTGKHKEDEPNYRNTLSQIKEILVRDGSGQQKVTKFPDDNQREDDGERKSRRLGKLQNDELKDTLLPKKDIGQINNVKHGSDSKDIPDRHKQAKARTNNSQQNFENEKDKISNLPRDNYFGKGASVSENGVKVAPSKSKVKNTAIASMGDKQLRDDEDNGRSNDVLNHQRYESDKTQLVSETRRQESGRVVESQLSDEGMVEERMNPGVDLQEYSVGDQGDAAVAEDIYVDDVKNSEWNYKNHGINLKPRVNRGRYDDITSLQSASVQQVILYFLYCIVVVLIVYLLFHCRIKIRLAMSEIGRELSAAVKRSSSSSSSGGRSSVAYKKLSTTVDDALPTADVERITQSYIY